MYGGITSCEFSPDGARLATSGVDGMAKIWDVRTGQELLSIQAHPDRLGLNGELYSPDGRLLATIIRSNSDGYNAQVKIWDAESGEEISTLSFPGRTGDILGLAFSPDGERLVTGSVFGVLKIWEVKTGKELQDFASYDSVYGADFSPDGKLLATASYYGTARIWDVSSGQILQVYTDPPAFYNIAFTPDGKKVIVSGAGIVYGYIIDTQELMRLADSRLTRWFTLDECRQYLHREQCPAR
jgi:WD40 repeat protein